MDKEDLPNINWTTVITWRNTTTGEIFKEAGIERFRWVAAGKNVCPNCENRAGVIGTQEYFDSIGIPKSGFSVCGQNCQCQLVPVGYVKEGDLIKKEAKPKYIKDLNPTQFKKYESMAKARSAGRITQEEFNKKLKNILK